jgi:2-keto-4-pentenoate hydratase/2-oxohepta-3-ene-1,7-dioic acid hydratase in catechol pathway
LSLKLNEEVRQDTSTALQIFPAAAMIEVISARVTPEPGVLIWICTPPVTARRPGRSCRPAT